MPTAMQEWRQQLEDYLKTINMDDTVNSEELDTQMTFGATSPNVKNLKFGSFIQYFNRG